MPPLVHRRWLTPAENIGENHQAAPFGRRHPALGSMSALAAPCAIGTTVNGQGKQGSHDKSLSVDTSTKNPADGQKAGPAKSVGAMNYVGAETVSGPNEKKPEPSKVIQDQNRNHS